MNGNNWRLSNNGNRATAYVVSTQGVLASFSDFTISGDDNINTSTNYSHTNATFFNACTKYEFNSRTYYSTNAANSASTTQPSSEATTGYTWSLTGGGEYASVNASTGRITVDHLPTNDLEMTLNCTVTSGVTTKTVSKTILLQGTTVAAPTITRSGNSVTLATATTGATIYYTTDGTTPSSSSTVYSGPINIASLTFPVTVKAIAIRNGNSSEQANAIYSQPSCETPVITVSKTGVVSITCVTEGATIRYTYGDNPADPTGSSPAFTTLTLSQGQIIKAIATKSDYDNSAMASAEYVATGVSGNIVVLDDREDHTWTYYSDKPDGDYPDQLRSPDPRNVKITYRGGSVTGASAVAVSATEAQNEFVYYKTIEKLAWGQDEGRWLTGNYAYKVIPNPFLKRPRTNNTTGTNGFWGFAGWKIVSGGEYINGHNNNDVLTLEEKINFVNLPAGNSGNGAVVFEATWTAATVVAVNANVTGDNGLPNAGTYETNFIVVSGNDRTVTGMTRNATVMGCYPDGTGATGARLSTVTGSANDLKIENINLGTGGSDFTANTGWLIVGRGCTGNVRRVLGNTGQVKIRIESGTYNFINPMSGGSADNANYGLIVFGNDYDRATNDGLTSNDQYADNSSHRKLRVINYVSFNGSGAAKGSNDNRDEWMDITIKSGYYGYSADYSLYSTTAANDADGFGLGIGGNTDNAGTYSAPDINGTNRTYTNLNAGVNNTTYRWQRLMSFYCGRTRGGNYGGVNRVLVEGGELNSINGGGYRNTGAGFDVCYHFRMKGGWVKGAIYGTASSSMTNATTKQVITGGEINGWIAGACNGTDVDNAAGENEGNTYIYLGGTAELRSHRKDGVYNNAWGLVGGVEGGNLFASGRGTPATQAQPNRNYCGSSYKTYAVVADQSQVEQGVYGGGYIGVAQNSHIYITGGTTGKVFGGASTPTSTNNTWMTQTTDIRQYGGTVKEGIYGGHFEGTGNAGKIHQTVNITINGGQVGVDAEHTGNVHGGGYGAGTSVGSDVTVTLGKADATDSATIYGNIYGGSALGDVNTNNTNSTTVTLNKALINGNLFGGALGEGAEVNGKITVTVSGGKVNGNVYGGGEAAAYSPNANFPVVNMTGGEVTNIFGGGKGNTAIVTGNPQVTLSGTAHVNGNVYGGGDAAKVTGNTSVIIKD
ncbi:MAG: chitobiase/beta-hexosaminidase C-terminal domain-containing protein [Bacteroidales bacterium]|nr:chitobiase/beta-hexosaminidase C-terminal domain-containing protein [Bacteroidales bacterium]